ncbi:phosphotransferase family protein [Thalassovita taeanensis]|uniref:Predicted kinase, aminoglycoside phosphotransferase (APT) family n=1 Tax=Thalassovita taeanensis TaxID=657014 RepID=A0A1H9B7H8_9RHOB|nr:phosphotransferase family protein [Thalassovita taeanensis]SEP84661.1 Predicted kinase, aminoglycoside phosphotransferase (APT) family [Thalassovita taeanensis]
MATNPAGQLDTAAVASWLQDRIEGFEGPIEAEKFEVGQSNPTFRLRTPKRTYVLRRKPPGVLLKSAHAVDREFRVQSALQGTDVPVAKMFVLCEDDSVIGSAFYVMEEIVGRHFDDPRLPELAIADRRPIVDEMNRVLAAIHSVDLTATGLSDYGPEGNYYRRQIDRWTKQYRASETRLIPEMEELINWLDSNIPEEDGQRTLVHGDYRIDNMLFAKDAPRCAAVLDWELSTIGHPYADLAAVIMQWKMPPGGDGRGLAGVDRTAEGLMSDEDFIAAYCTRRGLGGIDRFGFYLAFTFFRMAAIIQGVFKRALDGNASNPERARILGGYVPRFAQNGLTAAHSV